MLLPLEFKHINSIKFPVYPLPSDEVTEEDGLVFLNGKVLDDKNMNADRLGTRRLASPHHPQYSLRIGYTHFGQMLKSGKKYFIDHHGKLFEYRKTQFVKLKYKRIINAEGDSNIGILLTLQGEKIKVEVPTWPGWNEYAGILYLKGYPWTLYEYYPFDKADSRKKV